MLKRKRSPLVGLLPLAEIGDAPAASAASAAPATTAFDLSPCHRFLACADAAGRVRILPVGASGESLFSKSDEEARVLDDAAGAAITWCEFSPDGARIAAATNAGQVFLWRRGNSVGLVDGGALSQAEAGDAEETQSQIDADVSSLMAELNGDEEAADAAGRTVDSTAPRSSSGHLEGTDRDSPRGAAVLADEPSEFEKMRLEMLGAVSDYKDTQSVAPTTKRASSLPGPVTRSRTRTRTARRPTHIRQHPRRRRHRRGRYRNTSQGRTS